MPHTALSDEQILLLRLAKSRNLDSSCAGRDRDDIACLARLGHLQLTASATLLTAAGEAILRNVEADWANQQRRRLLV